ncbi:GNAT family N-acetyltransferase [Clostridium uliginosum]|uniref:Acetyltransferase (GNAT) domain-containing protein n=1 Tax=Clostridium uliginosum TaxID=119641 RepID=A0A1I1PT61_9CLOT|nr:GNAT family N-acetyltransferase [Clostridium uliginosum]SFD10808.1 Acetyltransferase (GNAT) domain-containing protein [Clostridium uliginosum]
MKNEDGLYRRNGKLVYIKQPEYDELIFTEKLWASQETMQDIGGVYNFTKNKWDSFYKKMVYPTDGRNFYCLIYTIKDKPVGEVSFHGFDPITKIARFNIKVHNKYRNNGYGKEAIKLMLEYYFFEVKGEIIMDNIKNESSKLFAEKLGFKGQNIYRNEVTYKLMKDQFLNAPESKTKNVSIIMYDNMDITNYTLMCDLFDKANEIANKDIFNIQAISVLSTVRYNNNFNLEITTLSENLLKPDIIILPNGNYIDNYVENKETTNYILTYYNNCDYICAIGEAIKFLFRYKCLEGISVPNIDNIQELIKENNLENTKVINKNFVDNGKVMISCNLLGVIEMGLSIIFKLAGKELVDKVAEKIGFSTYYKS